MRYLGDGSYSADGKKPEISLFDLLTKENEIVTKLNEARSDLTKAESFGLGRSKYSSAVEQANVELSEIRTEIRKYLKEKIGMTTNVIDVPVGNAESMRNSGNPINLSRMRRRVNNECEDNSGVVRTPTETFNGRK